MESIDIDDPMESIDANEPTDAIDADENADATAPALNTDTFDANEYCDDLLAKERFRMRCTLSPEGIDGDRRSSTPHAPLLPPFLVVERS